MERKINLVFIVLQYNTLDETIECVESIINRMQNVDSYRIVLIDNGSKKELYNKTLKEYSSQDKIQIIRIEKNVGFSKGNNHGYKYAKQKYNPEYYFFMSNDTMLLSNNLLGVIHSEYKKSQFDVLGGDIIDSVGNHTSPGKYRKEPSSFILERIRNYGMILGRMLKLYKEEKILWQKRQENVYLQGSALVFSKKAMRKLYLPFYPETYLYHEEDILAHNLIKNKMLSVYNPKIKISHKTSRTVDKNIKNKFRRKMHKHSNMNKGLKIYTNLVKRDRRSNITK